MELKARMDDVNRIEQNSFLIKDQTDYTSIIINGYITFIGDAVRGILYPVTWPLIEELGGTAIDLGWVCYQYHQNIITIIKLSSISFFIVYFIVFFGKSCNYYKDGNNSR